MSRRHRIHLGVSIRMKMVTLGMDLYCFGPGKPHAKEHKSIPWVTILLFIGSPWRIRYICEMMDGLMSRAVICVDTSPSYICTPVKMYIVMSISISLLFSVSAYNKLKCYCENLTNCMSYIKCIRFLV